MPENNKQVTPRKWSKKKKRIFAKQFDRYLYEYLYTPVMASWGKTPKKIEEIFDK